MSFLPRFTITNFATVRFTRTDRMLAKHYGFTHEELNFIINYDIKYRMGQESKDEEQEGRT